MVAAEVVKSVLSTVGTSKESISKFLIGNWFHAKLRIPSPNYNIKRWIFRNAFSLISSPSSPLRFSLLTAILLNTLNKKHVSVIPSIPMRNHVSVVDQFSPLYLQLFRSFRNTKGQAREANLRALCSVKTLQHSVRKWAHDGKSRATNRSRVNPTRIRQQYSVKRLSGCLRPVIPENTHCSDLWCGSRWLTHIFNSTVLSESDNKRHHQRRLFGDFITRVARWKFQQNAKQC